MASVSREISEKSTPKANTSPDRGAERQNRALVDLDTLMLIRNLELRARVVVQGFLSGLQRSPYHGFSVEFSEYRQYTPGDDPRYLDWRLYARSDRYYVKRFEDETNLRCYLLVDLSRSMGYGSGAYTKANYAVTLAATLGYFLAGQRDAVGLITFDEDVSEFLPARYRPGHLRRLMLALERPVRGTATNIVAPLRHIADLVTKRGLKVLISDLLAPIDPLETHLGYLRSRGHEVVVFQVLDPAELSFEFADAAIFQDLESGQHLYVDPAAVQRQYLSRLREHLAAIRKSCDKQGIEYHLMATDQPLELALFDYLRGRLERSRASGIRSQGSGVRRQRSGGRDQGSPRTHASTSLSPDH